MFERLVEKAETDRPMQQMISFLEKSEEDISKPENPSPVGMYAAHAQESMQFKPSIQDFVGDCLRRWTSIYVRKFQGVLIANPPVIPVSAHQPWELTVAIVGGGLIQQPAYGDVNVTKRQWQPLGNYLSLLFGQSKPKAA